MIKKKNSFFTFIFSFLPGGGQMYMGFMKEGISILSVFAFVLFLGSWLRISPLMFILPVVWFYSFFDSINKMSLSQDELEKLGDKYLFQLNKLPSINPNLFSKYKLYIALLLILTGLSILWNNMLSVISEFLPSYAFHMFYRISDSIPQLIVSIFIIYIGIKLIVGKKAELKKESNSDTQKKEVYPMMIQEIETSNDSEEK